MLFRGQITGSDTCANLELPDVFFFFGWFFKYSEAHRALILREQIDAYLDQYDGDSLEAINEDDWKLILVKIKFRY